MRRDGLTLFELVVALTIIGLFAGSMIVLINKTAIVGREKALQVELKGIRLSLVLYKAMNGQYPKDLRTFIETKYKPQGSDEVLFGENFLSTVGRGPKGHPIDPFGNRFKYNSKTGVLNSKTKGYENW